SHHGGFIRGMKRTDEVEMQILYLLKLYLFYPRLTIRERRKKPIEFISGTLKRKTLTLSKPASAGRVFMPNVNATGRILLMEQAMTLPGKIRFVEFPGGAGENRDFPVEMRYSPRICAKI